jgi:hypothetical protein
MSRRLFGILALVLIAAAPAAQAQNRWRFEIRGGPAFATEELGDASLGTGFGFEGTVGYRVQPHLSVYAGWDWHRFPADASFAGSNDDFEETGYAVGLQFEHPIARSESVVLQLRAGGTYNHVEVENSAGDPVTDSGHGLGWEGGAGLGFRLGDGWQITPGVRFRSLARDLTVGSVTTPANLRYLAVDVGFSRHF